MKPVIVLTVTFGLSCLVTYLLRQHINYAVSGRIAMAAMLVFTSVAHFVFWQGMMLMLPSFWPLKKTTVYITGVLELLAGIGLLLPGIYYWAGIATILFFIAILPANIIAARQHVNLEKADHSGNGLSYLWFRIPLQLFFIAWVYYFAVA